MSLEERLARLERMLEEVLDRLNRIESSLSPGDEIAAATRLVAASIAPASMALEAARTMLEALRMAGSLDPISRSIVEALSTCEELSISEVTRRVRRIRGSASRRIVSQRLRALEERGVVARGSSGYTLVACRGR